ncbi:MAG: serine hydrolase domain-containing protein, partial [Chromatocurvus sp.]
MTELVLTRSTVAPAFERVADAFCANFEREDAYREVGAAFSVQRGGEVLVDLAGGVLEKGGTDPWQSDTLVNVYSTTKGITALTIALLVERGAIAYEAPVSHYWPAFRGDGKERISVAEMLSHQAGLPGFRQPLSLEDLYDHERMAALLADQVPFHTPGEATCYHPLTFGFLADALVRHATGEDLRSWVQTLIHGHMGLDVFIGCPDAERSRTARLEPPPALDPDVLATLPIAVQAALGNPVMKAETAATDGWRDACLPAANGHASATGLAGLFSLLTNDGRLGKHPVLGQDTLAGLCKVRSNRVDQLLQLPMAWCAGLLRNTAGLYGPVDDVYGHSGWGGSFACADRRNGLSFAYVCNRM